MQRRFAIIAVVAAVLAMPALASATVRVTAPMVVVPGGNKVFMDVMVTADAGEVLNSMDFSAVVGNNLPNSPQIISLDISGPTTVFGQARNQIEPFLDPPGTEVFRLVYLSSTTLNVPANGLLARLEIDALVSPGFYPLSLNSPNAIFPPSFYSTTGEVTPVYIDGGILVFAPEPNSIVLGLLAIAGFTFVAVRHRITEQ